MALVAKTLPAVSFRRNIVSTGVRFDSDNDTDATLVSTTCDLGNVTTFKVYEVFNLLIFHIIDNGIVNFDHRVGVTDSPSIISDDHRDSFGPSDFLHHLTQFEFSLLSSDSVGQESTFVIIQDTEILSNF